MIDRLTQAWCILKSPKAVELLEDVADMIYDENEAIKAEREATKHNVYTGDEIKRAIHLALIYTRQHETIEESIHIVLHASLNAKTVRGALDLIEDDQKSEVEDSVFGVHQYPVKPSEAILPTDPFQYVADKLKQQGYGKLTIEDEIQNLNDYPGKTSKLIDATCAILTSDEYIANYGSWQ